MSIFSKNFALRKILNLFSNKIYQAPISDAMDTNQKTFDAIKIEIARIYDHLLDLRLEFLLLNAVEFYKSEYSANFDAYTSNRDTGKYWGKIMPPLNYEAGEAHTPIDNSQSSEPMFNYTGLPTFRSFDEVIGRSFLEISLIGLYFSNDPSLQTMLIKVLLTSPDLGQVLFSKTVHGVDPM